MYFNNSTDDLRSIKTEKALYDAMFLLLKKQSFKKITVKGICEAALISRAAFYAHFIDKYDLLNQWMIYIWTKYYSPNQTYEELEQIVNSQMHDKKRVLKHLIYDTDQETFKILYDFLLSTVKMDINKNSDDKTHHKKVILSNFFAGGIISYIFWQIKHEFPDNVPLMNKDFYDMIYSS